MSTASTVPQVNVYYGLPVNYDGHGAAHNNNINNAAAAATGAPDNHVGPAVYVNETLRRRARLLALAALVFHGGAAATAVAGILTPTATNAVAIDSYTLGTADVYLFKRVLTVLGGVSTSSMFSPDYCLYPIATAGLCCAAIGAGANGLLGLLALVRLALPPSPALSREALLSSPHHASHSSSPSSGLGLLGKLLVLCGVGLPAAAVACAVTFFESTCSVTDPNTGMTTALPSLDADGFLYALGFKFLCAAAAISLLGFFFTIRSLRVAAAAMMVMMRQGDLNATTAMATTTTMLAVDSGAPLLQHQHQYHAPQHLQQQEHMAVLSMNTPTPTNNNNTGKR